jgi:hypothetical protein
VRVVQIQRGVQLPLRQLSSRRIEAQHRRDRQLDAQRHLHTALGNDRLGRRSQRRTDPGVAIAVGETADTTSATGVSAATRRLCHSNPDGLTATWRPPKGRLVITALELDGGIVRGR